MTDPYEVLEVGRDADRQRVHAAFREQAREHHPDLGGDRETFKRVKRAYEQLDEELEEERREADDAGRETDDAGREDASASPADDPSALDDPAATPPATREGSDGDVEVTAAGADAGSPPATQADADSTPATRSGGEPPASADAAADEPVERSDAAAAPTNAADASAGPDAGGDAATSAADAATSAADATSSGADAAGPAADAAGSTPDDGSAGADAAGSSGGPTASDADVSRSVDDPLPTNVDESASANGSPSPTGEPAVGDAPPEEGPSGDGDAPPDGDRDEVEEDVPEQTVFWDGSVDPITSHLDETPQGDPVGGAAPGQDRLDRKINEWKSQLLDLTRRNDLIHLVDPPKTKSLPLAEENPTVVAEGGAGNGLLQILKRTDDGPPTDREPHEVVPADEPTEAERRLNEIRLNYKQHLRERGVDSLYLALGNLHWYDLEDADREYRSPLFLVPVDLEEQTTPDSSRHNYTLEVDTDGLVVNPALRKKLLADWHVSLPADDALSLAEIDTAFESVYHVVEGLRRWRIDDDVVLGIFDFTKVSLYNDLEENRERIKEHPIVRALVGDTEALAAEEGHIDVPAAADLDDVVDPDDTYQVLDADSSQQAAIEAANRGKSFVLQGPPGTGKSQTIANVIAEKLARGDTVLFVSEKQAALNVVKNRLDDAGVGRFCLEAHGTKASKRSVLDSLGSELRSDRIRAPADRPDQLATLSDLRETMAAYGTDLFHSPEGWDLTVYDAFGVVSTHADVPRVETGIDDAIAVGQDSVDEAVEALSRLGEFESEIADHHSNPWRHTTLTEVTVDVQSSMRDALDEQIRVLEAVDRFADELATAYDVEVGSLATLRDVGRLLDTLQDRPQIDWRSAYLDPELVEAAERLETLADLERRRAELREDLEANYRQSFFELDGADLHDRISQFGVLRAVKPAYRSLRSQVLDHATEAYDPDYSALREDLRKLSELQGVEDRRTEFDDLADRLGDDYRADRVDWDDLVAGVSWARELHEHPSALVDPVADRLVDGSVSEAASHASRAADLLSEYDAAAGFFEEAMATDRMRVEGDDLEDAAFEALIERFEELRSRVEGLPSRIRYENRLAAVRDTIADQYLDRFLAEWHPPSMVVAGFEKAVYTQWLNEAYAETDLGSFSTEDMDRTIREFRRLDREQLELASVAIQHDVTSRRPELDMQHSPSSEQQIVRREVEKQRNHRPLRELFDEAGAYIEHLTPCFMMSPLSVAQYLKADSIQFDTVIFDEASQIMPEDAISSIIRADQVIVAGDSKQLPPTSFFESTTETTEDVRADLESILKELAAVLPEQHLRWHYRSRTQDLIEFSNATYYDDSLQIFPENQPDVDTGIDYVYVEDGVYDRGGTRRNVVEAERVVDRIEEHAEHHPEKSLGVVAFSQAQEAAIRDELDDRMDDNSVLEAFVNEDDILDEFFVKNLEMVQGDERDRMIFSVGYGPDEDGELTMNFGPLNQTGGERRLNVAVTRAREKVTVVSSVQPGDIDLDRTSSRGVADFKAYLEYAKRKSRDRRGGADQPGPEALDTEFARSLYAALADTDMHVEPVGSASNYSLDLGIKPNADADAFALGIQCDGAAYSHSKTARDRERTRPSVLTDLGWDVHRVWSPSWVSDREQELELIREKVFEDEDEIDPHGTKYDQFPVPVDEHSPVPAETSGEPLAHDDIERYESPELPTLQDRALEDVPATTLRSDLEDVVADHGPIREDVAYRAVLDQWEVRRLDAAARETMSACANELAQEGELVQHDGFLWPARDELEFAVRLPEGSERREIDEIPLEELLTTMSILLSAGGSMEIDDLQLETARLYGYQRRGSKIRSRLDRAVEFGIERGILEDGERVTIVEDADVEGTVLETVYG